MPDVRLIHPAFTVNKGKKWFYLDKAARDLLPPDIVARLIDHNHPGDVQRQGLGADLEFRWTPRRKGAIRVVDSRGRNEDGSRIPSTEVNTGADGTVFLFAQHARHQDGTPDVRDAALLAAKQREVNGE